MSSSHRNSKSSLRSLKMNPLSRLTQNYKEQDKNVVNFNMNYACKTSDFVPFLNERDNMGRLILKNNEEFDDFMQNDTNPGHSNSQFRSTRNLSKEGKIKTSRDSYRHSKKSSLSNLLILNEMNNEKKHENPESSAFQNYDYSYDKQNEMFQDNKSTWKLSDRLNHPSLRKMATAKTNYFPNIMSTIGQNTDQIVEEKKLLGNYHPELVKECKNKCKSSKNLNIKSNRIMPPVGFYDPRVNLTQQRSRKALILPENIRPRTKNEGQNVNNNEMFNTKFKARPWNKPNFDKTKKSGEKVKLPDNVIEKIIGKKYTVNLQKDFDHVQENSKANIKYEELKKRLQGFSLKSSKKEIATIDDKVKKNINI